MSSFSVSVHLAFFSETRVHSDEKVLILLNHFALCNIFFLINRFFLEWFEVHRKIEWKV